MKKKIEVSYLKFYVSLIWSMIFMWIPSAVIFFKTKGKDYSYDEKNLYVTEGIFTKNTWTIPLYRITDMTVQEKMLPYGTIVIVDKSKSLELDAIKEPKKVFDELHNAWEDAKDSKNVVRNEIF